MIIIVCVCVCVCECIINSSLIGSGSCFIVINTPHTQYKINLVAMSSAICNGSILDLYSLCMFIFNYRNHRYAMIMLIKFPAGMELGYPTGRGWRRPDILHYVSPQMGAKPG